MTTTREDNDQHDGNQDKLTVLVGWGAPHMFHGGSFFFVSIINWFCGPLALLIILMKNLMLVCTHHANVRDSNKKTLLSVLPVCV